MERKLLEMTNADLIQMKSQCLADIREALPLVEDRLNAIDPRMVTYAKDVCREDIDVHNLEEILGLRKFIRMLYTYPFNYVKVHRVFAAYENLDFSGLNGRQHYALTPIQCFMLAGAFGPMRSEEDQRRVVTDVVYYIVRKFCKTTMGAFFAFWFMMFEDYNAEVYCVANAASQSKILYNLAKNLVNQLDPKQKRIRQTASICQWRTGQAREAKIEALSAGGKTKDGLFAQLCCADEYGSASYVNEKSDMGQLVSVVEGSMGPRREPMTLTTTTAGRISTGPFKDKLTGMVETLRKEMDVPLDLEPHPMPQDWQFAVLMQPDEWERDEESCRKPNVWRKCNPHIGITVQEDYYEAEWKKMDLDEEKKRENLCKLFNVYQSDRVTEWIAPDTIRKLQVDMRIDDCSSEDGWMVFAGMDFSLGDDLNAISYLAWRENPDTGREEFFADCDAWVSRSAVNASPLKALYQKWEEAGWLTICEGETVEPERPIGRVIELYDRDITFAAFGYDPYKAKTPINALSQWLVDTTGDANIVRECVIPVRQGFAVYNPLVDEMDYMIKASEPLIRFSRSPLWPWEFGNCVLAESNDGMENRKPLKRDVHSKVDHVQALLSGLHLFDRAEGTLRTE